MTTTTNKEGSLDNLLEEEDFLARYVTWALWALAAIVVIATVTGQVESYNGLYVWFSTHGITGFWADFAPLMVDSFTVVGELAIFAGISRHWDWKSRILPWMSALIGIASSVAANVGDKIGHPLAWELTAAIPPLAGAFGIVIGLGVLKRVARDHKAKKALKQAKETTEQIDKVVESIKERVHVGSEPWIPPPAIENTFIAGPSVETLARVQDQELKGMDVLIPPTQEVPAFESIAPQREEAFSPWEGIVQPPTGPMPVAVSSVEPVPVSREQARMRGLDPWRIAQTGAMPVLND